MGAVMCHKMSTSESDLALLYAIDGEGAEASLSIADYVSMNDWPSVHGVPPFPTCHREEDSDATGRQSASAPRTSAQVCECASNDLKDPEARSQSDTSTCDLTTNPCCSQKAQAARCEACDS